MDTDEAKVSDRLAYFMDFLRGAEQQYNIAVQDAQQTYSETSDILHEVELADHTPEEYIALCHTLREVRQRRRRAKDMSSALLPVVTWINANRKTMQGLEQLLGDVRKAERTQENRFYIPRTNILTDEEGNT